MIKTTPPGSTLRISEIINFKKLEHESHKFLATGVLLGIAIQLFFGLFITYKKVEIVTTETPIKAIKVDLIILPPQARNPYETWKRVPKKRLPLKKEFTPGIPVKDFLSLKTPGELELPAALGIVDTVSIKDSFESPVAMDTEFSLPFSHGIEDEGITRIPDGQVNLTDELINIDHFDTGQYKGFLIHDPYDKLNIKGYVHIPVGVRGVNLQPNQNLTRAISDLAEGFYRYSGITLKMDRMVYLTSPQLLKYPFIYLTSDGMFDSTALEKKAVKKYFESGGIALMEAWHYCDPIFTHPDSDETVLDEIRETYGDDVSYIPIPENHDIYNIVFDHKEAPVWGLFRERRLFLVYNIYSCYHLYGQGWIEKNIDDLMTGINIIVYALINSPKTMQIVDGSSRPMKNSRKWWDFKMQEQYQ
jgi:hypothetical protein